MNTYNVFIKVRVVTDMNIEDMSTIAVNTIHEVFGSEVAYPDVQIADVATGETVDAYLTAREYASDI